MITISVSIIILLAGYFLYSKIIERIAGADAAKETPAFRMKDGVDYVPLPWWRVFLIQFLNIAGLGPIFGALAGAMWGPVAFLWIVLGSVFGGAVHDYFSGMLSIKHNGLSITEIVGIYLGTGTKQFMRGFTVILMVLVGAVFILGPAGILAGLTPASFPVFPMMFITIACGAISGFHSTQSPLMARCITNEKLGRRIFYGAMISESIVAMIWAAIGMSFYGGVRELNDIMNANQGNAAVIVNEVSNSLLGKTGAILALLGVVAAPITSGDTAFRSARLIVADFLRFNQGPLKNRLLISIPLFVTGFLITLIDFDVIWRYFAWSNQTLAMIVLWAISVYLLRDGKIYWITLMPAVFMTAVTTTYLAIAPEGFSLPKTIAYIIGSVCAVVSLVWFMWYAIMYLKNKSIRLWLKHGCQ